MNERDKTAHMMQESSGQLLWGTESHFQQFADLIRADAMEVATRAANESWTLLAKALVLAEREACLNCYSPDDTATDWADKIRARGNT